MTTSELWQRIRAARRFAGMTQDDLAREAGISRSAYAFWEGKTPENRTNPNGQQLMMVARLTKVPVEWLMSNLSKVEDVWKITSKENEARAERPAPAPGTDRLTESYWPAVEFAVLSENPGLHDSFQFGVAAPPLNLVADFHYKQSVVVYCKTDLLAGLSEHLGRLLLIEAMLGRPLSKYLLHWTRGGEALPDVTEAAGSIGVRLLQVKTVGDASSFLLGL